MRHIYLVTYDIRDDKRLRRVFRTMRNWGDHLQYSVFECQLSPEDLILLKAQLGEIINHALDQVLVINLGPASGRGERVIEVIGHELQQPESAALSNHGVQEVCHPKSIQSESIVRDCISFPNSMPSRLALNCNGTVGNGMTSRALLLGESLRKKC